MNINPKNGYLHEDGYGRLILSQRQEAIVDSADLEWLTQWKWCAQLQWRTGKYYALRTNKKGRGIFLHRTIMGLGAYKNDPVDHINNIGLDNRRTNLRIVTRSANRLNVGVQPNNTSGFRGVYFDKKSGKWVAQRFHHRKNHRLGYFDSKEEAAQAREAYDRQLDEGVIPEPLAVDRKPIVLRLF